MHNEATGRRSGRLVFYYGILLGVGLIFLIFALYFSRKGNFIKLYFSTYEQGKEILDL